MENQIDGFIWSGYEWSIEDNVAYFVDAEKDILCELDLKTSECGGLAVMPNKLPENFMLNTRCLKINNEIFACHVLAIEFGYTIVKIRHLTLLS